MAVGLPLKTTYANGDVYSASDVNDTNGTVNLVGQTQNFYAGKNRIINGDLRFNQRNFTSNTANSSFNFDRFFQSNGGTTGTMTTTAQTFTAGTAPVSGYEAINFVQCVTAAGLSADTYAVYGHAIEDVRTLAGQTATISFWAKTTSGTPKIALELNQNFGSGGSPSSAVLTAAGTVTLSTSWTRYSITYAIPSISGKTVGTTANTSYLGLNFWLSAGSTYAARASSIGLQNATFQMWGFQIEAGSTATAFQTATGTIQGELAACQRYYVRWNGVSGNANPLVGLGSASSSTAAYFFQSMPVEMRATPTVLDFSNIQSANASAVASISSLVYETAITSPKSVCITATGSGLTTNGWYYYRVGGVGGYLGIGAEL